MSEVCRGGPRPCDAETRRPPGAPAAAPTDPVGAGRRRGRSAARAQRLCAWPRRVAGLPRTANTLTPRALCVAARVPCFRASNLKCVPAERFQGIGTLHMLCRRCRALGWNGGTAPRPAPPSPLPTCEWGGAPLPALEDVPRRVRGGTRGQLPRFGLALICGVVHARTGGRS